ncbi:hypothetical protein ABN764_19495 [Paenibacillaceae sp. P-4]|uniref:hypothetical protein n=1 Tax=Paenibacillaceae bacterium P-4 TaxID=3160969 RepID=UPI0032E83D09
MMSMEKFKQISLRGRVAYGVSCFENVLLALKYNLNDWKIVLNYLWEFTNSSNLEECNTIANELIPENLLEFKTYEKHEFERLSKEEFLHLYKLYQDIDESINSLLYSIHELGASHAYGTVSGYGKSSLKSLERLIILMSDHKYPLPSVEKFLIFPINKNNGCGNKFEGTKLSKIL